MLAFSTNAFAAGWVHRGNGEYKNTDLSKTLHEITIEGIPDDRIFSINVKVKRAHDQQVITYLRNLDFHAGAATYLRESMSSHDLFLSIDMNQPNRVKDLINSLNQYENETIEPDTILTHMKAKVDEVLATLRSAVASRNAENDTSAAHSTSASSATSAQRSNSSSSPSSAAVQCHQQEMATDIGKTLTGMEIDDIKCAICLENIEMDQVVTKLSCGCKSGYHESCIDHWIERKNTCPMCRTLPSWRDKCHL